MAASAAVLSVMLPAPEVPAVSVRLPVPELTSLRSIFVAAVAVIFPSAVLVTVPLVDGVLVRILRRLYYIVTSEK